MSRTDWDSAFSWIMHFLNIVNNFQKVEKFSDTLKPDKYEWTFLKRKPTYCTKCKEINICHLDTQKHVSYEKWFNSTKKVTYDH